MSRHPLLILRPEPGATMTAKRAFDEGWRPVISSIFQVEPLAWTAPDPKDHDALLVTSANAVRQAGKALKRYAAMPAYAVGAATARALKAAGFSDIRTGRGDAEMLLAAAAEGGARRALHLAGADHRDAQHEAVTIDRRIVYRSAPIDRLSTKAIETLGQGDAVVLLHSGRAAEHFAALCDSARVDRGTVRIAALSPAVLDAAGPGWADAVAAEKPDDAALLAAATRLCQ